MSPTPDPVTHRFNLGVAPFLLQTLLLNTAIAAGITLMGSSSFGTNWIYSQCIGISIGALINRGVHWCIPDWDRHWRRIALIVPLGGVAGFFLGVSLADALLGNDSMRYWSVEPRKAWSFLGLSLLAGALITYYFSSRAQLTHARQRAEIARRQAAEAQLRLLQSQLEPHMLFNTLANLRVLIGLDSARAQHMLDHLVQYLRATLDASRRSEHTLQEGFDRLRDYLALMAVRMGPRLRYNLTLPTELAQHPIPPLLLQALVENAVQHGLEPQVEGGEVTVSARSDGALLRLDVCDDGVGAAQDLNPPPTDAKGFGVQQVRERLQARYGTSGTIAFDAPHAGGMRVSITLPLQPCLPP